MIQGNTPQLQPTVWRTCRVLSNHVRLRLLGHLLRHPGQTVSEISDTLQLSVSQTSQALRALNSRGLLEAKRLSRWVYYRVAPDPSIPENTPLIKAIKRTFEVEGDPERKIFRDATAFTHPRRISIVYILQRDGSLSFSEIQARTGISRDALRRHLHKLEDRDLVTQAEGRWRLERPRTPFANTLLRIITSAK